MNAAHGDFALCQRIIYCIIAELLAAFLACCVHIYRVHNTVTSTIVRLLLSLLSISANIFTIRIHCDETKLEKKEGISFTFPCIERNLRLLSKISMTINRQARHPFINQTNLLICAHNMCLVGSISSLRMRDAKNVRVQNHFAILRMKS